MPTSSIFTTIIIDDPEKADKFIAALEASAKKREKRIHGTRLLTDVDEIRVLMSRYGSERED